MNTEEALRALAQAKARQKLADLYALIDKAGSASITPRDESLTFKVNGLP